MEYIVSARKYRPASFDAVVGQQALTTTLKNAVASGKLAHAYLFCGPRGVGKTTCARIFAKVINCEQPTPDGDACGECESCKAFSEQRSLNIFELDAASNNGVNEIKDLMEQTRIPPQVGKYKVFIIDEVHMLSTAAFNAFLKTLEEPPSHVVFILATTEKHKILPTILSRCQVYDFERMTVANIIEHLKKVAADQGVEFEEEALSLIAEKADGGMRDALSIFDQAASFCQGNITYQKVIEDLNVLDADNYFRCLDLALECKVPEVMMLLSGIIEKGFDGGHFVGGLSAHVRNVLMAKDERTVGLIETSEAQRQKYVDQAKRCDTRFLYRALKILNACDVNYRQSSNKRLLVELTLIEVAQILQKDDDAAGSGRLPWKILKSLFRKLTNQVDKPATQQGNGGASKGADKQTETAKQQVKTPPVATQKPKETLKLGGIGTSFNMILHKPSADKEPEELTKNVEEKETFSENELQMQWLAMCNRMVKKKEFIAIGNRLKNVIPVIGEFPSVDIVVENDMLKDEIIAIRKRIELTLAQNLHNGDLTIAVRVAEQTERKVYMMPNDILEGMLKSSESLTFLQRELHLEME